MWFMSCLHVRADDGHERREGGRRVGQPEPGRVDDVNVRPAAVALHAEPQRGRAARVDQGVPVAFGDPLDAERGRVGHVDVADVHRRHPRAQHSQDWSRSWAVTLPRYSGRWIIWRTRRRTSSTVAWHGADDGPMVRRTASMAHGYSVGSR